MKKHIYTALIIISIILIYFSGSEMIRVSWLSAFSNANVPLLEKWFYFYGFIFVLSVGLLIFSIFKIRKNKGSF